MTGCGIGGGMRSGRITGCFKEADANGQSNSVLAVTGAGQDH